MRCKRLLAAALTTAALAGTVPILPALAAPTPFPDVTDPLLAEATEFLRAVDVVGGVPGGSYNPGGTLTRAEFCKMAVCALDRDAEEPAQRGRTIFLDVGPSHWARGYVNLASSITVGSEDSATRLVGGVGNGNFQPDAPINYAQAVTILCRVLGYDVSDVATGGSWYDGYLAAAAQAGLTEGLHAAPLDPITRAQAAILFYNLYSSSPKGSKDSYLTSLSGQERKNEILLNVNATAEDGTDGAIKTTSGIYKTDRWFDPAMVGSEGTVLLDADGMILGFRPKQNVTSRTVHVQSTDAVSITMTGGEKLTIEPKTTVYQNGEQKLWSAAYIDAAPGSTLILYYTPGGKLSHILFPSISEDAPVMVLRSRPDGKTNPFAALAGGASFTMFKNGAPADVSDLRQYDVAVYDASSRTIQISDLRLSGVYESVTPSPTAPITLRLAGQAQDSSFSVLPTARQDVSSFRPGQYMTLLLTSDLKVAGAVSTDQAKSNAVGIAQAKDGTATVTLLNSSLSFSGKIDSAIEQLYHNQLVTFSGGNYGGLNLSLLSGSVPSGKLDTVKGTLGSRELADNILIFDQVKDSKPVPVSPASLAQASISSSEIKLAVPDYAGRIRYLVLNDATGDAYQYGFLEYDDNATPSTLSVRQADSTSVTSGTTLEAYRSGEPGGIAIGNNGAVASALYLEKLYDVSRSTYSSSDNTFTISGIRYPVAENVQCYNGSTRTWFKSGRDGLDQARAYSETLDLYYDRAPSEGGKIRMVVAN